MEQLSSLRTEDKFKKTEVGEIPVEWEIATLGDISVEIYRYPTYYNIQYVEKGIPEIRGELIKPNGTLQIDMSLYRFISKETAADFPRTRLQEGDFVISVRGTMGKVAIVPKELDGANITANLMRISPDTNRVYPLWLHQIFMSERFQEQLNAASSSTTIKTIKAPELKSFKFAVPTLSEQKKIADILSTIDSAFEKSDKVIEKTKELKKGLMQELLTRGIGHKRFRKTKLGAMPEEWEISPLRNLTALITKGTTPTTYGHSYTNDGVLFLRIENISEQGEFILGDVKYISGETNEFLARSRLQAGDVLFSIAGALGRVAIVSDDLLPANINQALALIRLKNDNLNNKYLKYILHSEFIKNQISPMAAQLAQANLNLQQVGDLKIPIPQNSEQKEIVAILSSVDEKIEKEVVHKEKLENIKKGLMQVLLKGKIRVK